MASQRAAQISNHLFTQGMLAGQVAIITGSGQGIGAEAARMFAREGARVVVQDIDAGTDPLNIDLLHFSHTKCGLLTVVQEKRNQSPKASMKPEERPSQ